MRIGKLAAIAATALVAGCATGGSSGRGTCLPVVEYPADVQRLAADEIKRADAAGFVVLPRFVEDYGELRVRARSLCPER